MEPEEIWITRTFGDLHEFSLEDEVSILILCDKGD